jgi:transcriptional antiterminator Rof (Rho-off)
MPLTDEQRADIDRAIAANLRTRTSPNGRTTLPTSLGASNRNRYRILADAGGALTDAGRYYYAQTGEPPPPLAAYDRNQALITRGRNDYVRAANGRELLVRSLGADGTVRLTALGRHYFQGRRAQWVVHVPVIIRSADGRTRRTHLPVSRLGLPLILEDASLSQAEAAARVRRRVLEYLRAHANQGETVLMELSDETWALDPDGEWQTSRLVSTVDRAGNVDSQALLRQPMAGLRSAAAHLPHPELLCHSAFEVHADKLCVPRQLAELLGPKRTLHDVCDTFDAALGSSESCFCLARWRVECFGCFNRRIQKSYLRRKEC